MQGKDINLSKYQVHFSGRRFILSNSSMKLNAFLIKDTTGLPFQLFGVLYSNNCNALTAEKKMAIKTILGKYTTE